MSDKGGDILFTWTSENDRYFLRDDWEICGEERYSLFRSRPEPYGRVVVIRSNLTFAVLTAWTYIQKDRKKFTTCLCCDKLFNTDYYAICPVCHTVPKENPNERTTEDN